MKRYQLFIFCFLFLITGEVSGQSVINAYMPFRTGLKWGIKDPAGNISLPPVFDFILKPNKTDFFTALTSKEIQKLSRNDSLSQVLDNNRDYYGLYLKNESNIESVDTLVYLYKPEFALIDKTGKKITPEFYNDIFILDSCYICKKSNQYYFVSGDGKPKGPWDYYYPLYDSKGNKDYPDFFLVNKNGESKEFHQFDSVMVEDPITYEFTTKVYDNLINYRKGGIYSILNNVGDKILIPDFDDIKISTSGKKMDDNSIGENTGYLSVSDSLSWAYLSDDIYSSMPVIGKVNHWWGVFMLNGQISIPFEYDSLELFKYYPDYIYKGYKNGKYYFIKPGKNPSPAFDNFLELQKLDSLQHLQSAYYLIQNGGILKSVLTKLDSIYIENWETGGMELRIDEDHTPCFVGGKFKILNENIEQVSDKEYDSLQFFVNDYVEEGLRKVNLRNYSDSTTKNTSVEVADDYPFLTFKNGLWGAIKPTGELLLPNKYNSLKLTNFNGNPVIETICDGLTGAVSKEGKVLIKPDYSNFIFLFTDVSENNWSNSQALFYQNDKMGVINMDGKEILPAIYDSIYYNNGYYFVNKGGKRKHLNMEIAHQDLEHEGDAASLLMTVSDYVFLLQGKWGVFDTLGKPVLEIKYDQLSALGFTYIDELGNNSSVPDPLFLFTSGGKNELEKLKENDTLIDLNSYQEYPDFFYDRDTRIMCDPESPMKNVKYGLLDKTGKEIISQCDTIVPINWGITDVNNGYYSLNYIAVRDTNYTVFTNSGKEVLPNKNFFQTLNETHAYSSYSNGIRLFGLKNKIDRVILSPAYNEIGFCHENLASALKGNKYGFINDKGNVVIPFEYDEASPFWSGKAKVKQNGKSFYIDKTGKVVK